jgi:hypothetical protein
MPESSQPDPFAIEPELLSPTPRAVRPRKNVRVTLGCTRILIFPHMVAGAFMLVASFWITFIYLFGSVATGKVVGRHISYGESDSYILECSYTVNGRAYPTTATVTQETYNHMGDGAPVKVRYMPLAPNLGAQTLDPGRAPLQTPWFLWLFTFIWNAIVSLFVWFYWVAPIRARKVIEWGKPVIGTITGLSGHDDNDSSSISVEYEFRPEPSPGSIRTATHRGKDSIPVEFYQHVKIGDPITVLYLPENPRRSTLYRCAPYEAIGH